MRQISWGFVLASFGSLLVSSYYDNIRGPLIPPVAADLGLTFTQSGWFLATSQAVATVATLSLMHALNTWSERTVMALLCLVGMTTAVTASAVSGLASMLVLGALVGATISPLGTMANVLIVEGTPPEKTGRLFSAMHSMFGLGSMIATAAVGVGIGRGAGWRTFYLVGLPFFALLMVWSLARLRRVDKRGPSTVQPATLDLTQILVVLTFSLYVAGEVTTSAWMTSYLVEAHGFAVRDATPYLTAYYLVMTLMRLGCAVWVTPAREVWALRFALLAPVVAFALGATGSVAAFAFVGLFGPFFPVFLARTSRAYPASWRSMTIWIIVVMNVMLGICSVSVGELADKFGIERAYWLAAILLLMAFALMTVCLRRLPSLRPTAEML